MSGYDANANGFTNGHAQPSPSPPLPLPELLRRRPGLSLLLSALLGAMGARCSPEVMRPIQKIVDRLEHCPDPAATASAECGPDRPCPSGQVCERGSCVKVANKELILASEPADPTWLILEIQTRRVTSPRGH